MSDLPFSQREASKTSPVAIPDQYLSDLEHAGVPWILGTTMTKSVHFLLRGDAEPLPACLVELDLVC